MFQNIIKIAQSGLIRQEIRKAEKELKRLNNEQKIRTDQHAAMLDSIPRPDRWEYLRIHSSLDGPGDDKRLSDLGMQGWEMAGALACAAPARPGGSVDHLVIFKKQMRAVPLKVQAQLSEFRKLDDRMEGLRKKLERLKRQLRGL